MMPDLMSMFATSPTLQTQMVAKGVSYSKDNAVELARAHINQVFRQPSAQVGVGKQEIIGLTTELQNLKIPSLFTSAHYPATFK